MKTARYVIVIVAALAFFQILLAGNPTPAEALLVTQIRPGPVDCSVTTTTSYAGTTIGGNPRGYDPDLINSQLVAGGLYGTNLLEQAITVDLSGNVFFGPDIIASASETYQSTFSFSEDVAFGPVRIGPGPRGDGELQYRSTLFGSVAAGTPIELFGLGADFVALNILGDLVLSGDFRATLAADFTPETGNYITLIDPNSISWLNGVTGNLIFTNPGVTGHLEIVTLEGGGQELRARIDTAPVPEPGTVLLLGSGLAGLVGSRIRKFRKSGSKK